MQLDEYIKRYPVFPAFQLTADNILDVANYMLGMGFQTQISAGSLIVRPLHKWEELHHPVITIGDYVVMGYFGIGGIYTEKEFHAGYIRNSEQNESL